MNTETCQSILNEPENVAWVHFKNGRSWKFSGKDCLVHNTRYGTEYRLFVELESYKPIWIGRHGERDGRHYYFTVESMLGADYVDFECGGRYYFDKSTIRGRILRKKKSCTK